jgi:N-ethylmaleimide reductase
MPRVLELHEIPGIIEEFRAGAERALRAGFDGVEIHGANGYLPDQFLQDGTNKRTDEYGGRIENRARFLLEVTRAAISAWGPDRVGVRISPSGTYGSMSDSNPQATFGYVTTELDRLGIAYLHVVEPRIKGTEEIAHGQAPVAAPALAAEVLANLDRRWRLQSGFGRGHHLASRRGPCRLRPTLHLESGPARAYPQRPAAQPHDRSTFYGGDARGYTDYPTAAAA